jgi:hypothetical protein
MIKLSVRKDMKSVSGKAAYLKEFKSLVYCNTITFMSLRISAQLIINCSIFGRYECTVAKSAIYIVIYTMEVSVYISQIYIIHKYKMKAFYNRTYSSNKFLREQNWELLLDFLSPTKTVRLSQYVSQSVYYFK